MCAPQNDIRKNESEFRTFVIQSPYWTLFYCNFISKNKTILKVGSSVFSELEEIITHINEYKFIFRVSAHQNKWQQSRLIVSCFYCKHVSDNFTQPKIWHDVLND